MDNKVTKEIVKKFEVLGINPRFQGYDFLRDAIEMVICNKGSTRKITKRVYPNIAEKYTTTTAGVERSMRYAIEKAFDTSVNINNYFENYLKANKDKVSNVQFISIVSEHIKNEIAK